MTGGAHTQGASNLAGGHVSVCLIINYSLNWFMYFSKCKFTIKKKKASRIKYTKMFLKHLLVNKS